MYILYKRNFESRYSAASRAGSIGVSVNRSLDDDDDL